MKQSQKSLLIIGLAIVILLNILLFGWLLIDVLSDPNGSEKTVEATDYDEETTCEETTAEEEFTSWEETTEESTTEEPTPEETIGERIEAEIPYTEIEKNVIRTFGWGSGNSELGYSESVAITRYPSDFIVGEKTVCILDEANGRIIISYEGKHHEVKLSRLYTNTYIFRMECFDDWITIWNTWEHKLMIYNEVTGMEMVVDLSTALEGHEDISRFLEVGGSYVVWAEKTSGNKEAIYQYDWVENKVKIVALQDKNVLNVSVEKPFSSIIGVYEDELYYVERGENSEKYILNRETPQLHLYTEFDKSIYRAGLMEYLSPDGHLYIMEMFEDRVEISEIKLTPEMVK